MSRRALLLGAAGAALGARAQAPHRYAVLSFVADRLEVVVPVQGTGSRIDRNLRREVPDAGRAFDGFALVAAGRAIEKTEPGAAVALIGTGPTPFHDRPERLFDGGALALPDAVLDAVERERATRLLLLTKHGDDARLRFYDSYVGSGRLRGLGFYLDHDMGVVVRDTGAVADGFIAPYVFIRLSLVDVASAKVIATQNITASMVVAVAESGGASDPWQMLDGTEKVRLLRRLLETEVDVAVTRLLGR